MVRRCCYCEIEFGVKPKEGDKISHGFCKRHFAEQLLFNDLGNDSLLSMPDEKFSPDMSQVFDG